MQAHPSLLAASVVAALTTPLALANNDNNADIEKISVIGTYAEGYSADEVSGASRLDLSIIDIPQSVSVLTAAQIADFQIDNLNAALDTVTGVNVQRIETDRTYYTARGFDITNFQIDGIGLPLINGNYHASEDTAIYERIEVIRGANGLMTGVGNPSATVNFIRKRATAQDALTITGSIGSWSNKRLQIDGNKAISNNLNARVVAVKQDQESYLDRYSKDKTVLYTSIVADLSDSTQLSFSHSSLSEAADGNNWGANPLYYTDGSATNYAVGTNTSANWSNWAVDRSESVLELQHYLNDDWTLRTSYTYRSTDEDSELFYVYGTPDSDTELGLFGYASEYDLDDKQTSFDLYVTGAFAAFGQEHQVVFGYNDAKLEYQDVSLYDFTTGNGFPVMPALPSWDGDTPMPTFADGQTGSDVEFKQRSIYASARLSLADNIHALVGARHNDYKVTGTSYDVPRDREDDVIVPYAGLVYEVSDQLMAYASYTETFQSQYELDINDEQLEPITGESKEIGFKHTMYDGLLVSSLAYFDVVQKNVAIVDDRTADLPPTEQRYIGVEGVSSDGFELEVSGQIGEHSQVSFGWTDFDIKGDETIADFTPSSIIKLAATHNFAALPGLTVGTNIRWQNAISRNQGVVSEGFANSGEQIITEQDSYALVGLMARYALTEDVQVALNINNVTDEKYINSLYWAQGYYGAPRNYTLSLTWKM